MTDTATPVQDVEALGAPDDSVQADYFGVDEFHQCMFPDNKTWVQHKTLAEGDRRRYLDETNRDVAINRQSGDMKVKISAGSDRHKLLILAVTGWNFVRTNQSTGKKEPVTFSKGSPGSTFEQWLDKADPKIVDIIEKDIRAKNPWLLSELTVEAIDQQIAELEEQKKILLGQQAGN